MWLFLTPDEQQDMFHLLTDAPCPTPNKFLEKIGLIQNGSIAIPLFTSFVTMQNTKKQEKMQLAYEETTNTIKRGDITISDMLTLSEFRLLKLLLLQKDTV